MKSIFSAQINTIFVKIFVQSIIAFSTEILAVLEWEEAAQKDEAPLLFFFFVYPKYYFFLEWEYGIT